MNANTSTSPTSSLLSTYINAIELGIIILTFVIPLIYFIYFMRMMRVGHSQQRQLERKMNRIPSITWDQIYDMEEIKARLDEIASYVMKKGKAYGVILFGPPGTGKTSIAKALANKLRWNYFELKSTDVMSKWYGESEYLLDNFFNVVELNAPAVVVIDEIDGFTLKREGDIHEVTHRLINIFLMRLQELHDKSLPVLIIGTTNIPQEIDEALLRPGRFDEVIYVPLPDENGREKIWCGYVQNVDCKELAKRSNRLSPADIKEIVEEVKIQCEKEGRTPTTQDFIKALENYKPSVSIQIIVKFENIAKKYSRHKLGERPYGVPDVRWDDLGDLEDVKRIIKDSIELPLKRKDLAEKLGIKPVKGLLLYGPPGTGKTSIAKALANELNASFIILSGEEISSAGPFNAGEIIAEKFHIARDNAPAIIFIDEIDMIARARGENEWRTALTELLNQMDGIRENEEIVVVGATNRPWDLDPAILRPGRFDKIIYVPPPDEKGRAEVLKVLCRGLTVDEETLQKVAKITDGYTPADLKLVVDEIRRNLLKEATITGVARTTLTFNDFIKILANVKPSVNKETLKMYEEFKIQRI
ncbi:AAA family ATPase [Sulfurisphaera tokodaii]|uniref:ATPase n=2 Tax=Sulfurisphaera tokodaii TaxID=111955 RepID=Q96ZY0_SULTO|nr:AAA family ATPase [Sulfurisphaera tokodaii]BAB66793.1 ATPase [Sulfurisphaera tokodaii str. 7]HII73131.1 AAA family ATPase [Sulfurisphaera tokodaii]